MKRQNVLSLFALAILLSAGAPACADGLAGLWEIQGTPEGAPEPAFTNFAHMDKDGTVTNIDPWFGTGLGQWEKVNGQSFTVFFTHFFVDPGGVGTVEVEGSMELGESGLAAAGEFLTVISINGFEVQSVAGTITATRQ